MLVLSRKPLESILIGSDVRITVLKVERSHVRIGIEAPGSVTILRAELVDESADTWDVTTESTTEAHATAAAL